MWVEVAWFRTDQSPLKFYALSLCVHVCQVASSCLTVRGPTDCSLSGSSVHGILQARILERVAMPSSRGSSRPRERTRISFASYIGKQFFFLTTAAAKSLPPCPTLCNPTDGSPPGSTILGFFRQEHWSGLPFPSPMRKSEKWKWSHWVVSNSQRPHGLQHTRLLCPWSGVPLPSPYMPHTSWETLGWMKHELESR